MLSAEHMKSLPDFFAQIPDPRRSQGTGKNHVPVDVNRVIEECFLMIGEQLRLRDIVVQKTPAPDLPRIKGESQCAGTGFFEPDHQCPGHGRPCSQ